ncbi:MAM and LDL-receptor class A domain-containing protein 1 [Portunus trituberculatus]|uniref:MAM and LDL-receptor class A domain-containing protein 1 n=1 Tax=Portunus trituberculatus TaxID=210409 RepID=A0A5B7GGN7_PORTR|nr:MAM and LDL-receptor class A domain-containing protein 1 [Portunus trituberculatus]
MFGLQLDWEVEVMDEDSIILVDNIMVSSGGCPVQSQSCDFEYEDGHDKYCGGQYIVADFSKASGGSETTRMYGPQVRPDSTCFSFWFILDVHEAATLRVVLNDTSEVAFMTELGTGGMWQLGASEVGRFGSHGNAVFEVFSSAIHRGYVAIDDVKMENSKMCPVDGRCDFEKDTCGWRNTGNLQWVFSKLEPDENGPSTETHLMFVTPGDDLVGYMATLTSPILLPDFNCVRFWFKKAEEAPVSLRVVVTPGPAYLGEHFEVTLWVLPDTITSDWQEGQLSIPHYSVDAIQVYIEAKRLEGSWSGGHNEGLVHIDDVEVSRSSECSTVPPEASTKTTTPSSHLTTTPKGVLCQLPQE